MVKFFYRVLGVAAWANERSSRQSVNFIPGNWLIMVSLGLALMIFFPEVRDAALYGAPASMGSLWLEGAIFVVMALTVTLFMVTFLCEYIVFQQTMPTLSAVSVTTSAAQIPPHEASMQESTSQGQNEWDNARTVAAGTDLRVTGKFVLDKKTAQSFLNVPSAMKVFQNGDIALFSKIDASTTMYGTVMLKQRVGIWYLMMQHNSLRIIEPGVLYFGWSMRPALRIYYTDAIKAKPASTVLSFANEADREAVTAELLKSAAA